MVIGFLKERLSQLIGGRGNSISLSFLKEGTRTCSYKNTTKLARLDKRCEASANTCRPR